MPRSKEKNFKKIYEKMQIARSIGNRLKEWEKWICRFENELGNQFKLTLIFGKEHRSIKDT